MEEIVNIENNKFIISLKVYENNQLTNDYPCIVFSLGENNPCENWSLEMKHLLPILCEKIVSLILTIKPEKFCFYTRNDEIYQLYKSMELPYIVGDQINYKNDIYNIKEVSVNIPGSDLKISFYDKVN